MDRAGPGFDQQHDRVMFFKHRMKTFFAFAQFFHIPFTGGYVAIGDDNAVSFHGQGGGRHTQPGDLLTGLDNAHFHIFDQAFALQGPHTGKFFGRHGGSIRADDVPLAAANFAPGMLVSWHAEQFCGSGVGFQNITLHVRNGDTQRERLEQGLVFGQGNAQGLFHLNAFGDIFP